MNLEALGGPFRTVYDVGGSVGGFAEAAWRRWPGATIYSFEPRGDAADESHNRSNGRWRVFEYGLADEPGPRLLKRCLNSPEASTLAVPGPIRHEAFGAVDTYVDEVADFGTLDNFVALHAPLMPPALLKIDVEGSELLVLQGGRNSLPKFDTVVVELSSPACYVNAPAAEIVDEYLRERGFQLRGRAGALLDPRDDSILQWDGIWTKIGAS